MTWPPKDDELKALLVNSKIADDPYVEGVMDMALAQFEQQTGFSPFVASGVSTVYLDPPDGALLWLPTGYVSISSVAVYYDSDSGSSTALTLGTGYRLIPHDWSARGAAADRIEFLTDPGRTAGSVVVTGTKGRMSENDERLADVRHWLLRGAAASVALEAGGSEGPLKRLKQGPVDIEYGIEAGRSRIEQWERGYWDMVDRYKRIIV